MTWWIWLVVGVGLLLLEVLTAGLFFFLFLGAGALVVGALLALGVEFPLWAQIGLFSVLSVVAMVAFRQRLRARVMGRGQDGPEVDSLVGEAGAAVEDLPPGGIGKVELRGSLWNARNDGDAVLAKGSRCRVAGVEGLTVRVRADGS
ncbi:MAG: NfeD family protein [Deltaproteobacteria bacterium]|nr:NfeD family protein [Deltaproteobacteria bacterium]